MRRALAIAADGLLFVGLVLSIFGLNRLLEIVLSNPQ
jgi:hypothetical protein